MGQKNSAMPSGTALQRTALDAVLLELFYKGLPATEVAEYAEIELRVTNTGPTALDGLSLWLGREKLRDRLGLRPGGSFGWAYNVGDLVGELVFKVGQAQATLMVAPQKLSLAEVGWIKTERLPRLLARLDAPNRLPLRYADADDEQQPRFDFISADFTAIKLRYYCEQFLTTDLAGRILERLDFGLEEQRRRDDGFIRGGVRWNPTIRGWLNRPAETGLVHEWAEAPRDYTTLPNLLFLYFLKELAQEVIGLVRLVQAGAPASARLKEALPEFENYARQLENSPAFSTPLLRPAVSSLETGEFDPRTSQLWPAIEQTCHAAYNPAYHRLVELWQEYNSRYVRLPDERLEPAWAGLQPMSKIYELWAACEIANGLGLTFEGQFGLESAVFKGPGLTLHYNRAAPGGWYSAAPNGTRLRSPRPDLRLELPDGSQLLLDVKYRNAGQPAHAHPDDIYRMLAYMNDLAVGQGGIIFPGEHSGPTLTLLEQATSGQRLAEFALRPPASDDPSGLESWQTSLKASLSQLLN